MTFALVALLLLYAWAQQLFRPPSTTLFDPVIEIHRPTGVCSSCASPTHLFFDCLANSKCCICGFLGHLNYACKDPHLTRLFWKTKYPSPGTHKQVQCSNGKNLEIYGNLNKINCDLTGPNITDALLSKGIPTKLSTKHDTSLPAVRWASSSKARNVGASYR